MLKFRPAARTHVSIVFLSFVVLSSLVSAFGQNILLQATPLNPSSVVPGVTSTSTITVSALNGFSGTVDLTCVVTPVQATGMPTCAPSPLSVTPPAQASLTFSTTSATPSTLYTATVTGTSGTLASSVTLNVTVLAVTREYTITVTTPVSPTSVHAGSGATGIVTVTPINGYAGKVTVSCSAIAPTATPAPSCAFSPATVDVTNSTPQTTTLTISTTGPSAARSVPRVFYAILLPVPGLALVGLGLGRAGRGKKLLSLFILSLISSILLLMPACGSSSSSTSTSTTSTPKNTYSFTLTGADANSIAPSNGNQTVSLTVN